MLSTAASTVMYASSMVYTPPPTVTSGTIMYNGLIQQASHIPAKLKMQGKGQLDNQLQEWQMRQEAQKQVERAVTAHRLTLDRNIRILEMASTQKTDKASNSQINDNCMTFDSALVDTTKSIMMPSFAPVNFLTYPPGTISIPMYYPFHELSNVSVIPTQDNSHNVKIVSPSKHIGNIPNFPLPGTSHGAWLNWHQTTSPTSYIRNEEPRPVPNALLQTISPTSSMRTESRAEESRPVPYNPAQMQLDYLPFTSEDEITETKMDDCLSESSYDSDDEEYLVVFC